jgi:predicted nucleotidyltransferase
MSYRFYCWSFKQDIYIEGEKMENLKEKYPLLFEDKTKEISKKFKLAWKNVKLISKLLKEKYDADTIIVFGSLTDKKRFHKRSDIDLAVSGIANEKFYKAYGEITSKFTEFEIDLVDIEDCKESLLISIKKGGIRIE